MSVGVLGIIGTVISACKATLRAEEVLDKHHQMMNDVEEMKGLLTYEEIPDEEAERTGAEFIETHLYTPTQIRKETAIVYLKTTGNFAKLYGPTVALGSLSVGSFLAANNIMKKRYLGAVAAYNAVSGVFENYRERVREELGENADRRFLYGEKTEKIEVTDPETGKKKKEEIITVNDDPSGYARYFDSTCLNWNEDPTMSLMFLKAQQEMANHILKVRGHIFLNEVYDMLGLPHTQAGAVVGWVNGMGDSYIDFGLYDKNKESVRRFINGQDNVILLDFNVDGVIFDKI